MESNRLAAFSQFAPAAIPRRAINRSSFLCTAPLNNVRASGLGKTCAKRNRYRSVMMSAATPNDLADDEILIDISELDELEGGEFDFEMDDSDIDIEDWPDSMLDINSVQLTGRLGRDPVLKEIGNDQVVCTFSMAVKHEWDPSSTSEEDTSWFDIEIWGSLGKYAAQYGRKGLRVGVSGEIDVQGWIDRNGEKCSNPIITADSFEVLQSKNESTPSSYGDRTTEDIRRTNDVSKSSRTDDRYSGIQVDGNLSDLPF